MKKFFGTVGNLKNIRSFLSPTESFLYTYRTYKDYKSIQCYSKTGYDCFGVVENMSTSFIHHLFSYVLVPYRLPVTVQLYNKSEVIKIPIYNYRYLVWSLFFFVIKILLWNKSNFLNYSSILIYLWSHAHYQLKASM